MKKIFLILFIFLTSCAPQVTVTSTATSMPTSTPAATQTATPMPTSTLEPTQTPTLLPEETGWQKDEPPMTAEHIKFLDTLDLPLGSTSSLGDLQRNPELDDKVTVIGKTGYVHDMSVSTIKTESFSGKGIYLYIDFKNGDGTYTQVPVPVAVKSDSGKVGFGMVDASGDNYQKIGYEANGLPRSITFEEAIEYFRGEVGKIHGILIPVWDSQAGKIPYIPDLFAEMMTPNYGSEYPPGDAPYDMYNGFYRFALAVCSDAQPCNMADPSKRANNYSNPVMLRELALQFPEIGLLISDINEH